MLLPLAFCLQMDLQFVQGGSGLHLRLDQVPTREPGISPYEMMLSETQERMLLVVEKGTEQRLHRNVCIHFIIVCKHESISVCYFTDYCTI
jgi:hypothetical protein